MPLWIDNLPGLPVLLVVLGLCLGSFLNVVIHRLPTGGSLLRPGSHCPSCGRPVSPRDNVPVLGWLLLKGRCRRCGAPIGIRYPAVELIGAICVVAGSLTAESPGAAVARSLFLLAMTAVFFIDLDHRLILDVLTLPGMILGLAAAPWFGVSYADALIGAAAGTGGLWLLGRIYAAARNREGLGGGDIKLAGMFGACLGWQGMILTLLIGSAVGVVAGLALMMRRDSEWNAQLPYGSFLAPAAAVVLIWGRPLWSLYLGL